MAVYTEVSDEELLAFVRQYEIGEVIACKGIAEGVENSNFLLQTDRGLFILTIYEKRVAAADLPYFLGLLDHLAAREVPCPTPVHGRDGAALRSLADKPAAIVTFLRGVWPRRPLPQHCAEVGAALAAMHLAGGDFAMHRGNNLGLQGWGPLVEATAARADEVAEGLAEEVAREYEALRRDWPTALPDGVIHADLFPDNVFFLANRLSGLIDFYFACNDALDYDLAICLNAWCFESDAEFSITKARRLITGYRSVREISREEVEALPRLIRGAALRFLLTRLYDWLHQVDGALVKPKDPLEYLAKLRFHRQVASPGAYGLD